MSEELAADSDGDALRRLAARGSDLSKEIEIDFAVDVHDEESGLAFARAVEPLGFRTEVDRDDESGDWTCYCSRRMIPDYDAIISVQKLLEDIGGPYHARPDGWGSFGNASQLPDDALVVRGGRSSPVTIAKSIGRHPTGIIGLSVVSAPGKALNELCRTIPHISIRTSTVGEIRRAGGDVVSAAGKSPFQALLIGWRAEWSPFGSQPDFGSVTNLNNKTTIRLFADFDNADQKGRIRLNTKGTHDDLRDLGLELSEGLNVELYDGEEFVARANVHHCAFEGWTAVVDWDTVKCEGSATPPIC